MEKGVLRISFNRAREGNLPQLFRTIVLACFEECFQSKCWIKDMRGKALAISCYGRQGMPKTKKAVHSFVTSTRLEQPKTQAMVTKPWADL